MQDLSFFVFDDLSEYQNKVSAYPFDDFDNDFASLPSLEELLSNFLKNQM